MSFAPFNDVSVKLLLRGLCIKKHVKDTLPVQEEFVY
jgi:hypothetical protein